MHMSLVSWYPYSVLVLWTRFLRQARVADDVINRIRCVSIIFNVRSMFLPSLLRRVIVAATAVVMVVIALVVELVVGVVEAVFRSSGSRRRSSKGSSTRSSGTTGSGGNIPGNTSIVIL